MTVAVSKAGPYYASGEIKFSSLRSNFRAQVRKETPSGSETFNTDTNQITASELRRSTSTAVTNPTVPDATENANISTGSDWKTSQFRNSIKYYYITQTDTELNLDIDSPPSPGTWNSNLDKNVRKFLFVGTASTCGSNNTNNPAARLDATAYNLTVDVYGDILGASGRGGGTYTIGLFNTISGENGGDALQMTSTNGANNIVLVRDGARIYGGGGGGEKGTTGDNGTNGSCYFYDEYQYCSQGTNQNCNQGTYQGTYKKQCCEGSDDACNQSVWRNVCIVIYNVNGGTGGAGGNGGPGRGYNNQFGSTSGSNGANGTSPQGCTSGGSYYVTPTAGGNGNPGAAGGEYANAGGNTTNTGNGGAPGKAVFGSNYSVTGTINADTIKGTY